ncbi:MAG TPA: hypothetical protein VNW29_00715 [Candidatus Sulfotelmatobacter sp.]|jgi:hypothetical protein|nr:hypothetical protein [Candidatus Sulfotelmatobacter sp.]
MKPIKLMYVVILVIVFAAAGFYGGMMYQKTKLAGVAIGRFGGAGRGLGSASGMIPVRGQIVGQEVGSITLKLQDGSSKIINLTAQTRINKATTGSVSDLKSGINITALGVTNSDGSVTADNVTIGNGLFRFRGPTVSQ